MMCSGIGGNGNAPKACDVGEELGEEVVEEVGESIVVVCGLLVPDVADVGNALVLQTEL